MTARNRCILHQLHSSKHNGDMQAHTAAVHTTQRAHGPEEGQLQTAFSWPSSADALLCLEVMPGKQALQVHALPIAISAQRRVVRRRVSIRTHRPWQTRPRGG